MFAGFNNHRQSCIFGATLLYDETQESFKWLFSTFLKCMNYKCPKSIFTDQDLAMAGSIKVIYPSSFHGLYTLHIMENAKKNLSTKYTEWYVHLQNI